MRCKPSRRGTRSGNALVELVLITGVWTLLLAVFLIFCQIGRLRYQALRGARFGAILQSSHVISDETVRRELGWFFGPIRPGGMVEWSWQIGRFTNTPASRFYRLRMTEVTCRTRFPRQLSFIFPSVGFSEKVVIQEAP
jgi:hypothetical protein